MSKMLLIYVAGPYRAPTVWETDKNIHNARVWGAALAKHNVYPVIPHSNMGHMEGAADDSLWLTGALELLSRCDGAIFIPGWSRSRGAGTEYEVAISNRISVLDASGWEGRGGSNVYDALAGWTEQVRSGMDWSAFAAAPDPNCQED